MDTIRDRDSSFEPFLDGMMSVEKDVIVSFRRLTRDTIAYFMWRDPVDGRFHTVGNMYDTYHETRRLNEILTKQIEIARGEAVFYRASIDVSKILLPDTHQGWCSSSSRREYPEKVLHLLSEVRRRRREFLEKATESEAAIIKVINDNNLVENK
jgi:hypothetical protein